MGAYSQQNGPAAIGSQGSAPALGPGNSAYVGATSNQMSSGSNAQAGSGVVYPYVNGSGLLADLTTAGFLQSLLINAGLKAVDFLAHTAGSAALTYLFRPSLPLDLLPFIALGVTVLEFKIVPQAMIIPLGSLGLAIGTLFGASLFPLYSWKMWTTVFVGLGAGLAGDYFASQKIAAYNDAIIGGELSSYIAAVASAQQAVNANPSPANLAALQTAEANLVAEQKKLGV